MVMYGVLVKAYAIMIFATGLDEMWNMNNPRPFPQQKYYLLQWEEKDFYTFQIDNQWVLRKYRKTDDETKRYIRNKYWEKRNGKD